MNNNEIPEVGKEFELFENGGGESIDRVTVIGIVQHSDGRLEIKTTGEQRKETDFCCQQNSDSTKWLVLHRDPKTNERCFSSRGPLYSLKPIQQN